MPDAQPREPLPDRRRGRRRPARVPAQVHAELLAQPPRPVHPQDVRDRDRARAAHARGVRDGRRRRATTSARASWCATRTSSRPRCRSSPSRRSVSVIAAPAERLLGRLELHDDAEGRRATPTIADDYSDSDIHGQNTLILENGRGRNSRLRRAPAEDERRPPHAASRRRPRRRRDVRRRSSTTICTARRR